MPLAARLLGEMRGFTNGLSGGLYYYLLAIIIYFGSSLLWALRWWLILKRVGDNVSYFDAYIAIMGGILFNNITPSLKLGGESFRAAWVWITDRVPLDRTLLSIFYERLTEVPGVLLVGIIAISAGLLDIVHATSFHYSLLALSIAGLSFDWIREVWRETVKRIKSDAKILVKDWRLTVISASIGIIIWIQDFTRFYLIARAVGIHISIGESAILSIAYLVLGMGPTPAGIGFVEGGLTSIIIAMGYPVDKAGLIVLGERLISSVMASLVGLILILARGGIKMFREVSRIARSNEGGVKPNGKTKDSASIRLVLA